MWPDNHTDRDFLNFSGVSDTVGEIIVQARGRLKMTMVFGETPFASSACNTRPICRSICWIMCR
jgi:hypothetical protein